MINERVKITRHVTGLRVDADWVVAAESIDENVLRVLQPRDEVFPFGREPLGDGRIVDSATEVDHSGVWTEDSASEIDADVDGRISVHDRRSERCPFRQFHHGSVNVEDDQWRASFVASNVPALLR